MKKEFWQKYNKFNQRGCVLISPESMLLLMFGQANSRLWHVYMIFHLSVILSVEEITIPSYEHWVKFNHLGPVAPIAVNFDFLNLG